MVLMKRSWLLGLLGAFVFTACGDDGGVDNPDAMPPGDAVLAFSSSTGDFGTVAVGATSAPMTFTLDNDGESASGAVSASVTGDFDIDSDGCTGTTLAAGASCTISVTFSPSAEGAATGELSATASPGDSAMVALSGEGAPVGELEISPTPHDFGDVVVGSPSDAQDFTVENTGGSETSELTASISGGDASQFDITADDCTGASLAAGATCTVTVVMDPSSTGSKLASLSVDGSQLDPATASLSGNALADADLGIDPVSRDFGSVTEGTQSSNTTFTVTNEGGVDTGTITSALGGTDAADFTIQNDSCDGITLAPEASCTVIVRFTPAVGSVGAKSASLNLTASPGGSTSAVLTADSLASGALTIEPTPHDFGDATVGSTGDSNTFTVTNTGGSATGAISVALGGSNPTDFPIVSGGNGCQGVTLQPQGTCTISVNFAPTNSGGRSASLGVSAQPGGSAAASLSGNGLSPAVLVLTPPQADFGSVATNKTADLPFTLTNTGDTASGTPTLNIGGTNFGRFEIQGTPCNAPLAGGDSCTITVRFSPNAEQSFSAVLEADASPGGSDTSNLVGEGISPAALGVSPSTHDFEDTVEDQTSAYQLVTVTNNGDETTGALTVGLGGMNPGQFEVGTDNCSGATLALADDCTVEVRFAPTTPGTMSASLTISGTPGGAPSVALSGEALEKLIITELPNNNPPPVDFGDLQVGQTPTRTLVVSNPSASSLDRTIALLDIIGTDEADFTILAAGTGDCVVGTNLMPGASCTVDIEFTASGAAGERDADFRVTADGGTDVLAHLDANVLGPLVISPDPLAFGEVVIEAADSTKVFTVTNMSASNLGPISTEFTTADDFAIVTDTCVGEILEAFGSGTESCTITVKFYPLSNTSQSGTITVTESSGPNSDSAAFTGLGRFEADLDEPTVGEHDFGPVIATTFEDHTFTFTNNGDETAAITSVALTGDGAYAIRATPSTCDDADKTVAAGASCDVVVRFAPSQSASLGTKNTNLAVSFDGTSLTGMSESVDITGESTSQLEITPDPHDFDPVVEGGQGQSVTFTVRNNGAAAANAVSISHSDPQNAFSITSNNCINLAGNGGECEVGVRFEPPTEGEFAGTLTADAAPAAIASSALTGTGLQSPVLAAEPGSLAFGAVIGGSVSETQTVTFRNDGEVSTTALNTTLSSADFSIEPAGDLCDGMILAANGGACTITVRFTPDGVGDPAVQITAPLTVTETGAGLATASATLSGYERPSNDALTITPSFDYSFANTVEGQQSDVHTFLVTNSSNTTTSNALNMFFTSSLTSVGHNFVLEDDLCTGNTLAPGDSCSVGVRFKPNSAGTGLRDDELQANDGTGGVTYKGIAAIRGRGVEPAALSLSPSPSHVFPDTAINTSSDPVEFTVTNTGEQDSSAVTLSKTGATAGHFLIQNDQCSADVVPGGQACTFEVVFHPTTSGTKSASVSATATTGGTTGTTGLSGNGVSQAVLGITPDNDDCGSAVPAEAASVCDTFTVSNGGGVESGPLDIDLGGSAHFQVTGGTCKEGDPVPTTGCSLEVTYVPQNINASPGHNTTLTVSASPGSSDAATLTGDSVSALSNTGPGNGNFGSCVVLGTSPQQTFTIDNATGTPATESLVVTLDDPNKQFGIAASDCDGVSLDTLTCSISVEFVPTSTGTKEGSLSVTAGSNKVVSITLTGTAADTCPM